MSQMPPPAAPPPGYGGQPYGYGAPPPPGYGAPPPPYGAPPGYGAPPPPYGAPPGYGQPAPAPQTSGAAIGALVCGILGCLGITALIAIILGVVGIRATGRPNVKGRGMAIAGLILGLLFTVGWGIGGGVGWAVYSAGKPVRAAAKQFAGHLGSGNVSAAQAMCGSSVTPEELQHAAERLQAWGGVRDTTLVGFSVNNNNGDSVAAAGGAIHLPNGDSASYAVQFTKENGVLKVQGFNIQNPRTNETINGGLMTNQQSRPGGGGSSGSSSGGSDQ